MAYPYNYRRRLPHIQPGHKIFFVTFCTYLRWHMPPIARTIVLETCITGHGKKFELYAMVVMADHVHLALTPMHPTEGAVPLPEILQAIKSASAHRINKALGRHGKVWQEESFDCALRKEEHFEAKLWYMLENPVRAGLVENPLDYQWLWRNTGGEVQTISATPAESGAPLENGAPGVPARLRGTIT
jgi:REP element-mobilizing transposase RayT